MKLATRFGEAKGKAEKERIADALAQVGLSGYERRKVYTLSGGEQQRVAISAVKTCRQLKKALFDKKNVTDKELVSLVLQLKSGRCEDRGGAEREGKSDERNA